jgi:hypothetical protein
MHSMFCKDNDVMDLYMPQNSASLPIVVGAAVYTAEPLQRTLTRTLTHMCVATYSTIVFTQTEQMMVN